MRSPRPPQRRNFALPQSCSNASAKYMFTPGGGYTGCVRIAICHDNREGNRFVDSVYKWRADLATFLFDNIEASNRIRMFRNRPRTIGISAQGSF